MKISIVTASFNQGVYVGRSVASVRDQVGDFEIEHIIFDNCSTDGTVDILKDYEANPGHVDVRLFIQPDNGQTEAINTGFALATGDIVCWLNTDEWYEPGALACVVGFFEVHPELDVVFGGSRFVDSTGKTLQVKHETFFARDMLLFYGCFLPSCATFLRRKIIDDGIVLDPEYRVAMDFDWYMRIADGGYRFAPVQKILAAFTWHDSNISTVEGVRAKFEGRSVRDRHALISGPEWYREVFYAVSRIWWLWVRLFRNKFMTFFSLGRRHGPQT